MGESAAVDGVSPGTQTPEAAPEVAPSFGQLVGFGTGSIGMGVWVEVPGLLLLFYLTNIVGVDPLLAGLTLFLPKLLDIVMHPWIGTVSDRQLAKRGNRRLMMYLGLFLGLLMTAMFSVPNSLAGVGAAIWVACFYILGNISFATFQVPYITTPSDLDVSYHQRTRVWTYRMFLLTIGLLAAGIAAPALVAKGRSIDYTIMSAALGVVMLVTCLIAIMAVKSLGQYMGSEHKDPKNEHLRLIAGLKVAWRDRNFRMLVLSYLFTGATTHLFLAGVPFYAKYVLGDSKGVALLTAAFLLPALIGFPAWLKISKKIGKQKGLLISQAIFVVGSLGLLAGKFTGIALSAVIVIIMGFAFAGLQLLAYSMVPDVAREASPDGSKAGTYTGVWTATEATGTAFGPYVYAAVLAIGGFVSSTADESVTQTSTAISALVIGFTIVPAVLMTIAIMFQRGYKLGGLPRIEEADEIAKIVKKGVEG